LGSYYSDQPNDTTLFNIQRFVDEVEQVRAFYKLDNFYLLGHSWGGLLAMEYALKYPDKLKGLIVSNKSYSIKNLIDTRSELTEKIAIDLSCSPKTLDEMKNRKPVSDSVESSKILNAFRRKHLLRLDSIPDAMNRNRKHITRSKGFSNSGWDILDSLQFIRTPALLIGSKNDFVKEADLIEMKKRIKTCDLCICPNGSHFAFWDDTENYFSSLRKFINKVEAVSAGK
jgi:proline iminopeptidase